MHNKILNSLGSRGPNYVLPQIEFTLFKNSFLLHCVFRLVCCLLVCFYCLLFMCVLPCNVSVCHAKNKRQLTYLLTYFVANLIYNVKEL